MPVRLSCQAGRLLRAALGFAGLARPSYDRALWALRFWLDFWSGIGHVVVGMARQGYDLQLTLKGRARVALRPWRHGDGVKPLAFGYTWHCNRHTWASRLVMAGVGLRALEELGSWRTLAVVERYSHLSLDHLREAAERIVSDATETKASASTPAPQRRQNFGDTASRTSEQRAVVS